MATPTTTSESETALQQAAQQPKRFDSDNQSVHAHALDTRMKVADRFAANANAKKRNRGLLFARLKPGGAT